MAFKVMIMIINEIDEEKNPVFRFETLTETVEFMKLCWKNNYDAAFKDEDICEFIEKNK